MDGITNCNKSVITNYAREDWPPQSLLLRPYRLAGLVAIQCEIDVGWQRVRAATIVGALLLKGISAALLVFSATTAGAWCIPTDFCHVRDM